LGWDPVRAVTLMLFSAALVAAIFIDLRYYIIPDQVNAFMWVVGIGYNAVLFAQHRHEALTWGIPSALAGWLVGVGALWTITFLGRILFGKDAMGHGDIKMARGIGAVLFPIAALMSFALAVVLGAVLGAVQILVRRREPTAEEHEGEVEDQSYEPESIGSILKCGIGYVLCFDVIGLFIPRFSILWFGEDPYAVESAEEEPDVDATMIPFGPYLALGAIVVALFESPLKGLVSSYWQWATGDKVH
jgi:leader peptidase (prepilin peptidase)/N-methyltransferase